MHVFGPKTNLSMMCTAENAGTLCPIEMRGWVFFSATVIYYIMETATQSILYATFALQASNISFLK